MTIPIHLMLVFHNHQPVGQFDHIAEHSTNVSYLPLIELLERYPGIRVGLHYSGALLAWLKQNHTEVIERLRLLVARKQVEMLSGGYYEPVLAALPDEDKIGQIEKLNTELRETLGADPMGLWLAEHVWEPHLARPIAQAGLKYVILEDTQFESVGIDRERDLYGYFMTEEQGYPLAVFPSLTHLRNSVPSSPVETLIEWLRAQADQPLSSGQPKVALMGEDGEKFGTWSGTYEHCWGDGKYMEALFDTLEGNAEWLKATTPADYLARFPALGRVYLPSTSYANMDVWSLPPDASHRLKEARQRLEKDRRGDMARFLRGGTWRGFMVKYDEVNHMHKRVLLVSEKVHSMRRGRKRELALDLLWAAQGNDPFWHGLFGGTYLFNLRVANYANLIAAENAAEGEDSPLTLSRPDFDRDSHEDVMVTGWPLNAVWAPASGGALLELDYRPAHYNVLNVMTRHKEGYHIELVNAAADDNVITPLSPIWEIDNPHGHMVRAKESGLEKLLLYDWHRRASFLDHFLGPSTTPDEFYRAQYAEQGDFVNQPYAVMEAHCTGAEVTLDLCRDGHVWIGEERQPVRVQKVFGLRRGDPTIQVTYRLSQRSDSAIEVRFAVETVVGFDGGQELQYAALRINDDPHRLSLDGIRECEAVTRYYADTNLRNLTLRTELSRPTFLWQFPLETITLSEAGFERGYQGTVFLHVWNLRLPPGEAWQVTLSQSMQQTATRP